VSFNLQTQFVDFMLPKPQLVHGSFFTQAGFVVRSSKTGHESCILYDAANAGFRVHEYHAHRSREYPAWSEYRLDDEISVKLRKITLTVRAHGWEMNVTRKKIYNALPGQPAWKLNMAVEPLDGRPQLEEQYGGSHMEVVAPHGIVGQSFDGDDVAVSGEVDDYSQGREITTRAQAGGAIEGVASDYRIPNLCFNKFFWNRFYTTNRTAARDIRTLAGKQTRSTKKYHAYSTDEDEF
jgi:hypothetical protein